MLNLSQLGQGGKKRRKKKAKLQKLKLQNTYKPVNLSNCFHLPPSTTHTLKAKLQAQHATTSGLMLRPWATPAVHCKAIKGKTWAEFNSEASQQSQRAAGSCPWPPAECFQQDFAQNEESLAGSRQGLNTMSTRGMPAGACCSRVTAESLGSR